MTLDMQSVLFDLFFRLFLRAGTILGEILRRITRPFDILEPGFGPPPECLDWAHIGWTLLSAIMLLGDFE